MGDCMAKKKTFSIDSYTGEAPATLDGHPFFGIPVDDPEQIIFRDALWNPENRFVAVDACSGSGKSTIGIAVALLLCKYGRMDELLYLRCPTSASEGRLGFLPGSLAEKTRYYMQPLYNVLATCGENPFTAINDDSYVSQKDGTSYITPITDVYIRGDDWSRKVIFVDECQNATVDQLRTIITRAHDDCLVILAGSTLQIDMKDKTQSGFTHCMEHFKGKPWAQICTLSKNYRGEMSAWADLMK